MVHDMLPQDSDKATLIGRVLTDAGPTPVAVKDGQAFDLTHIAATVADMFEMIEPGEPFGLGTVLGSIGDAALLSPVDLQCIKASGVTFAVSALERVIEERARGDAARAIEIRTQIQARIGADLGSVKPGSDDAAKLKAVLIADDLWSQYLEVAIGPDAEIFTKAPVLSSVGTSAPVGVRRDSEWNNPEPEIVLIVDSRGRPRGAALGNDVNLRDIEGRSALLLGKAKDNNASCAIGPFIRLFDTDFTMDDIRQAEVSLTIDGKDGYHLTGSSNMSLISRDPLDLISQAIGRDHQFPDGFVLFLGTMFAPVDDRDAPGLGFTHKEGDIVRVSTPKLGTLTNYVLACDAAPPWTFGIRALMTNLAARGLLDRKVAA